MKFGVNCVREAVKGSTFCSCPALYSKNKHGYLEKLRNRHDGHAVLVFGDAVELISVVLDSFTLPHAGCNRNSFK